MPVLTKKLLLLRRRLGDTRTRNKQRFFTILGSLRVIIPRDYLFFNVYGVVVKVYRRA